MKTENEFYEHFLGLEAMTAPTEAWRQLSKNYWGDLTSHLSFYFSHEDRLKIAERAAALQLQKLSAEPFDKAWKQVILDFNQNNYWGFQSVPRKPKYKKTEEQLIFWKIFKYVWAFFQSMIILKIAVYYFGLESAMDPNQTSVLWVWFFIGLSTFSLVFFAYRNRHDQG